ncbi:MAG: efflux RND transporter permease subunit [Nannocystales bacterium]
MIDSIIRWSLQNRLVVLTAAVILLVWGAVETTRTPVDVFPDLTAPTVTVITEAHGMAPEEVETLVTFPIETALNGAAGVRRIRSSTAAGIALVWVEFEWDTDIFRARQTVAEKLQLVASTLPSEVEPPVLAPVTSIMGEIMFVAVQSEAHSPMDVRTLVDWTIRPRLLAVPGVSQVVPIGGARKTLQVAVNPENALQRGIALSDVIEATRSGNQNAAAGFLVEGPQENVVRGIGRAQTPEDLAQTMVESADGYPIAVREVSQVSWAAGVKRGDGSFGASPAVVIGIQKQPSANTLELTGRIDTVLDDLEASLPDGMTLQREGFRQASFIGRAVDNVSAALRDGAILVVMIVLVFLASGRATIVTALAIPLSLLCTVLSLQFIGASINTMTLGGMAIAVGALVDDAIIDTENVVRRLRENAALAAEEQRAAITVVFEASREIRTSIVFATLVIGLVFVPVFFLEGVEGRLLAPLGFAYIVSLFASLVVALTVTPVLCLILLPGSRVVRRTTTPAATRILQTMYAPVLALTLSRWRPISAACLALLGGSVVVLGMSGRAFLPEFNEGALTISVVTIPGTSLEQSNALGTWVEEILMEQPEVASTTRRTGRAELDEHAQGVNAAEIDVRLTQESSSDGRTRAAFSEALRAEFALIPGTAVIIGQPISHRIDHMLSGTRANVAVKIFGPDLQELRRLAERARASMEGIDGVVDLTIEQQSEVPTILARFDRAALARYGLTIQQASETMEAGVRGLSVSRVLEGNISFDVVVRLDPAPSDFESLGDLLITSPSGARVPLRAIAQLNRDVGPSTISREDVERKAVVSCNVAGRALGSVVQDIRAAVGTEVPPPDGYRIEYGGQFQSAEEASRILLLVGAGVILGILVLLVAALRSTRDALLVMLNLPLALIGGVLGVFLSGGVLSVASMIGFITLFGIATRNGIMLVSHFGHLVEQEGVTDRKEAVLRGSVERLAPILMTAIATALGLVPLMLAAGDPGSEIQAPMAVVILSGLATSTALNMLVVPALYLRFGRYRLHRRTSDART